MLLLKISLKLMRYISQLLSNTAHGNITLIIFTEGKRHLEDSPISSLTYKLAFQFNDNML